VRIFEATRRVDLDPRDPAFVQDPYPAYAACRQRCPIFFWEQLGHWCLARHDDVDAVLRDRRFGRQILHLVSRKELGWPEPPPHLAPVRDFERHSLLELEPPAHTRLRSVINPAFLPRAVAGLAPLIARIADRLIDDMTAAPGGRADLLTAFATPLPVLVIATFLGVPREMAPQLLEWSHAMVAIYQARRDETVERHAAAATVAFGDFVRGLLEERRRTSQHDVLTTLLAARDAAGRPLSTAEITSTVILLLNAGHEATVHALGNGMLALLRHSHTPTADLLADPAGHVEEMLRFDPPLHLFTRYALTDLEFRGCRLERGDRIGLLLGAANRDPDRFTEPDAYRADRRPNPHVSFGAGIHACVGAPLARLEMQTALRVLCERLPGLRLAEPPVYRDTWHFRGLETLPVAWDDAADARPGLRHP
jgi:cytochrome P450